MVEYTIMHSGVVGFESVNFKLDLVRMCSDPSNRSYPNLSNCCSAPLNQVKVCGTCKKEVNDLKELKYKQFKLGKEAFAVSVDHLKKIKDSMDDDRIQIVEYRPRAEIPDRFFTDVLFSSKQSKKHKREYVEYMKLLEVSGMVGTGMCVINSRPYPVMVYVEDGHIVVRGLHFGEEVKEHPGIEMIPYNEKRVQLLSLIFRVTKNKPFDINRFVNVREEEEQKLIEKVIKGETLPEVEKVEIQKADEAEEMKKLQELLKASGVEIPA